MTTISIKSIASLLIISAGLIAVFSVNGCKVSQKVAAKTGVQLWTENCQRCHNTPSAASFSAEQWETIGLHMQSRALLTDEERKKIVEFMKQ
ncbi:MAG: cytochrome c [Bacteroidota bacterium]|nr:cytochrome c [Bacteroidota bacterium]MDP4251197.1 cytochrome c [Bacteroidota bacterium]